MKFTRSIFIFLFLLAFVVSVHSQANNGIKVRFSPDWIGQGQSFAVKITSVVDIKGIKASVFGTSVPFFAVEGGYRSIIGVPVDTGAGKYRMLITVEATYGTRTELSERFTVSKSKFDRVSFWLKKGKADLLSADIVDEDWAKIAREVSRYTPVQLWGGTFRKPTDGTLSMRFGTRQVINGRLSGQHRGVDIAGKSYYKIRAANSGQVVFAGYLRAFGNTVVINHGQGVFTLYFHLSKIAVSKYDLVWKGAVVGNMGSTGVSTGVHLHWAMSVSDVRVDPMQWMGSSIVQ